MKLIHSGPTISVTPPSGFVSAARYVSFFSTLNVAADDFLFAMALLEHIADGEKLPIPLTRMGFWLWWGFPF